MEKCVNIIIVDDNARFRKNLILFIQNKLANSIISEASNGLEFLNTPYFHRVDIVLMDIAMDVMDGFEATQKALWKYPNIKILALTMHQEKVFLVKLIETGFKGCVFKNNIYQDLLIAMETVMNGDLFFAQEINLK